MLRPRVLAYGAVLVLASVALAASSLLGGLSTDVPGYVVAAMVLGVYFAFIQFAGVLKSPDLKKFFAYIAKTAVPTIKLRQRWPWLRICSAKI